jgi:hypothetical protein
VNEESCSNLLFLVNFFSTRKTDFVKFINTKNLNEQKKWRGKEKGTFLVHLQGKSQSHETGTLKQF